MSSVSTALVIATLPSAYSPAGEDPPSFLSSVINAASATAQKRVVVVLISRLFNKHPSIINNIELFPGVQRLLTYIYVQASRDDHPLLEVDVILRGLDEKLNITTDDEEELAVDAVYRVSGDTILIPLPTELLSLPQIFVDPAVDDSGSLQDTPSPTTSVVGDRSTYAVTALGGTFDHLHSGHKILLSMAAFVTSRRIIVGVTHSSLLVRKTHASLIESLDIRIENVRRFLKRSAPHLEVYDIVPIEDVYGPTAWDTEVEALVVSKETLRGADEIAKLRASKSLSQLDTLVVDVISYTSSNLDDSDQEWLRNTKMSSTAIREWIYRNGNGDREGVSIADSAETPREAER
ncbi:hypothetical protein AAF712_014758 [Marasmius tenuissimus]|uniref:Cytidyltransferase-like domain-containing protein n=1 Tax=Marasmius tenuissimus TaxID=585030 RepID=A0ABR2ZA69_9AGAR